MSPSQLDRRRFLWNAGGGLGGIALAHLLGTDGLLAEDKTSSETRRPASRLGYITRLERAG